MNKLSKYIEACSIVKMYTTQNFWYRTLTLKQNTSSSRRWYLRSCKCSVYSMIFKWNRCSSSLLQRKVEASLFTRPEVNKMPLKPGSKPLLQISLSFRKTGNRNYLAFQLELYSLLQVLTFHLTTFPLVCDGLIYPFLSLIE